MSCLKFYGQKLLDKIECVGGSSAGALTACMLICDMDLEASVQFVMHLASKVHGQILGPLSPEFEPCEKIRKTYMTHLPADAYKRVSGKLFISLTRVSDFENVVVSDFSSNKELVDVSFLNIKLDIMLQINFSKIISRLLNFLMHFQK